MFSCGPLRSGETYLGMRAGARVVWFVLGAVRTRRTESGGVCFCVFMSVREGRRIGGGVRSGGAACCHWLTFAKRAKARRISRNEINKVRLSQREAKAAAEGCTRQRHNKGQPPGTAGGTASKQKKARRLGEWRSGYALSAGCGAWSRAFEVVARRAAEHTVFSAGPLMRCAVQSTGEVGGRETRKRERGGSARLF